MHAFLLLAALPAVLACANPTSNSCASFIRSQSAIASPFCNTFTRSTVTATTGLPAWASACTNKPSMISKECSCHYTAGGNPPATSVPVPPATTASVRPPATTVQTTVRPSTTQAGGGSTPTGLTTTLPASSGLVTAPTPIVVSGSFDGGMRRYDRNVRVCAEQEETGEADSIFILEAGATLSNVIIGSNQAEGVHCRGTCTLNNIWWTDVCEDAATFKMTSGTSYVNGGGAFRAADKIFQFNGFGTLEIRNFYANDYGRVVRSCGNCSNNGGARNIRIFNSIAVNGNALCGINTNYGDTCVVSNTCQDSNSLCDRYRGNNSGAEPVRIGSGADGTYCSATGFTSNC